MARKKDAKHVTPYYSADRGRGTFAGYGVLCREMLTLHEHEEPFETPEHAARIMENIEKLGWCSLDHRVVRVYHRPPGRGKKKV